MGEISLAVNGYRYAGWKSIRVTQSIESVTGSFALGVHNRWAGQEQGWPIVEEDACRVEDEGEVLLDGYVEGRRPSLDGQSRTLEISGRGRTAALVDCSVILDRWSFRNVSVLDFARKVAAPFDIKVSMQSGLTLPKLRKLVISPGDTAFEAIAAAARTSGVLLVSDGAGGLLITRAGTARAATPIIEGENLLTAAGDFSAIDRYSRYVIATQVAGTDQASGDATRIRVEATDQAVRRTHRTLLVRPESGMSVEHARRRADWEARIRAARADSVTVGVRGWRQPTGDRWPLNGIVYVRSPWLGVDGELLISQLEYSVGDGGEITKLSLVRPDAFTPEPKAKVKRSEWKKMSKAWTEWWEGLDL